MKTVSSFLIIVCSKCGGLSAAKAEQKTKICPYCGNRILLYKSRRVGAAGDASEASRLLRILKRKAAEERKR